MYQILISDIITSSFELIKEFFTECGFLLSGFARDVCQVPVAETWVAETLGLYDEKGKSWQFAGLSVGERS